MASINDFMMPQFHKLNGKNYPVWKQKMEQALSYYGLWEIVTGATPKPDLMSNSYTYENKTALRFLTFALEDDILPHIRNINTAVDVWMKLKSLYETSNELRISFLRNKLTGLKMESSDFITDHIQKLQELKNELSAIDSDIKDKEFITILFNSLPNEYQNFVISFGVSSQKETPTFEETVGLLLQEEQRLQKNDFSEPDRDFTGRHRGSGQAPRGGHSWHPNWIQNSSNQIDSFQNSNQTDTFQSTNQSGRFGEIVRVTKETNVQVKINLDGSGISDCNTGIPFLDHMLDQIASHGIIDMQVKARGDIHIDDHHTNEDVALAFGSSLLQALGDRKGIYRFGDFSAPLDEALVHVALDLSGRPYLGYNLCIPSQRVGTYDTQLVEHFFQSLVNTSGMTLHIRQLAGKNSHHIIEATFKAFARALRQATEYDTRRSGGIPSSKGVLSRT